MSYPVHHQVHLLLPRYQYNKLCISYVLIMMFHKSLQQFVQSPVSRISIDVLFHNKFPWIFSMLAIFVATTRVAACFSLEAANFQEKRATTVKKLQFATIYSNSFYGKIIYIRYNRVAPEKSNNYQSNSICKNSIFCTV